MSFLTRAKALGSLCGLAFTSSAGVLVSNAVAASKIDAGDLKALAATLALERAAVKAYADAAASNVLAPPVLAVLNDFLADHTAHRDAIVQAIVATGQAASDDVAPLDTPALRVESDILSFAYGLERSLAAAHLSALPAYKNRDYAQTTGSILGVETTHVALLGEALRKGRAYPSSFVTA